MAIRSVVTRGFGNGTYSPGIYLATTRGYAIGEAVAGTTLLFVMMQDPWSGGSL